MIIHYKHEQRLAAYKKDLHRLWNEMFADTSISHTRLIVGNRINQNAKRELTHNRPPKRKNVVQKTIE